MQIRMLEHYNIRTTKFEETVRFYVDGLGLRIERAPMAPEGTPATWLYGESGPAVVHLTPVNPANPEKDYGKYTEYRNTPEIVDPPAFRGSGSIDHIAFRCDGYQEVLARLKSLNIPCMESDYNRYQLRQIFVKDPNGITLELYFD